jgi:hypothetical protein
VTGITDTTTAFSTSDETTNSESVTIPTDQKSESTSDDSTIIIIVGVIAGVLVVCGLIAVVIMRRRKSNSKDEPEAGDNSISLEPIHYQSLSSAQPITPDSSKEHQSTSTVEVATSDQKLGSQATKSWEIDYSELKILGEVGEGAFGTVHRAIFRHQQVAVKQMKNQIDKKEVCKINNINLLTYIVVGEL